MTDLTPEQARVLWYLTATTGFVEDIAKAYVQSELHIMGVLIKLKDMGLAKPLYNTKDRHYQWCLTEQGLAEHERRMDVVRNRDRSSSR